MQSIKVQKKGNFVSVLKDISSKKERNSFRCYIWVLFHGD